MMRYSRPLGKRSDKRFISALMAFAVSMALEPGCWVTGITVAGKLSW